MKTVLLTIFILAFATYVYTRYGSCGCGAEGFKTENEKPNPLVHLIKKLGTMTKYLSDPHMWKDRIEMVGMSPADLARRHLNSMKQQK